MTARWRIETATGAAADLLVPAPVTERLVRFLLPDAPAVVLGSTQPETHVDRARAAAGGVPVVRRRSGGGAVLVGPDRVLWVDVALPADDPLWLPDVGRAFWWLGEAWVAALDAVGFPRCEAWHGGLIRTPWSDRVCFAGLGPGEVSIQGAKVVGLSQRRTRAGVHFQCAVSLTWNPSELLGIMALDPAARVTATTQLAEVARGVGPAVTETLPPAFLDNLP